MTFASGLRRIAMPAAVVASLGTGYGLRACQREAGVIHRTDQTLLPGGGRTFQAAATLDLRLMMPIRVLLNVAERLYPESTAPFLTAYAGCLVSANGAHSRGEQIPTSWGNAAWLNNVSDECLVPAFARLLTMGAPSLPALQVSVANLSSRTPVTVPWAEHYSFGAFANISLGSFGELPATGRRPDIRLDCSALTACNLVGTLPSSIHPTAAAPYTLSFSVPGVVTRDNVAKEASQFVYFSITGRAGSGRISTPRPHVPHPPVQASTPNDNFVPLP